MKLRNNYRLTLPSRLVFLGLNFKLTVSFEHKLFFLSAVTVISLELWRFINHITYLLNFLNSIFANYANAHLLYRVYNFRDGKVSPLIQPYIT